MAGDRTAETWGLSGPEFLWLYGAACALAALWAAYRWRRAAAAGRPPLQRHIGLYDVALLNGGPQLAITSAATQLHLDDVLEVDADDGTLAVAGRLHPTADPLEHAIVDVVARAPGMTSKAMRAQVQDSDAIRSMTGELTRAGLLMDESRLARLRSPSLVLGALAVVGVARIVAGLRAGTPTGGLSSVVILVTGAAIGMRLRRRTTREGRALVRHRRENHEELHGTPASANLALAAALFGGAALWLAEPAFATALEVPRDDVETRDGQHGCSSGGGRCGACGGGCGGGCGG